MTHVKAPEPSDEIKIQRYNDSVKYQRKYQRQTVLEFKQKVVKHYSNGKNCCLCCGESKIEFLSIDHMRRTDYKQKIAGYMLYRWLIKKGFPEGFRVLCYNCNCSMGYLGYCPHKSNQDLDSNQNLNTEGLVK